MGIEPTLAAWEAAVLPLNYTRDRRRVYALFRVECNAAPEGAACARCAGLSQKVPLSVAKTVALLPSFWPTVALAPISASSPNS